MMKLKTYQASTMAQALACVRRELGKDAVILNTRTLRKGGLFGLGARNVVEITATCGINVLHPDQKKKVLKPQPPLPTDDRERGGRNASSEFGDSAPSAQARYLKQELTLVKQMVQELLYQNKRRQHPAVPQELFAAYLCLINQQVAEGLAGEVIDQLRASLNAEQIKDPDRVRSELAQAIEKMLPPAQPIALNSTGKPRTIALVGPTGVGKTTTIAKLAANFKLRENKAVGLVTIDTYRIAAVDQLRTYADIINVPLRVVLTPEELRETIGDLGAMDLILIDTAGRGQNDELKLRELKSFLQAAKPDEIHLVLSTTASQANLLATVQRFASLNVDRIIFTKLDEAVGLGILLNVVQKLQRAVSYITTGQNVPEDIEPGTADRLSRLLLNPQYWPSDDQLTSASLQSGEHP